MRSWDCGACVGACCGGVRFSGIVRSCFWCGRVRVVRICVLVICLCSCRVDLGEF